MGAAIPIVATAVSVAGTASQISAQNRQASRQNAAISAQISANEQSEAIRLAQSRAQREILKQQYQTERIARTTTFTKNRSELNNQLKQSRFQQKNQIGEVKNQVAQQRLQSEFAREQISSQVAQSSQASDENTVSTLQQLAQSLDGLEDPVPSVTNLRQQIDNTIADVISTSGSQGRSSGTARASANAALLDAALNSVKRGEQIDAQVAQQLVRTGEFNDLLTQISEVSAGTQNAIVNSREQSGTENADILKRQLRTQGRGARQQLRGARQLLRSDKRVQGQQASINRSIAEGSLITGLQLQNSQIAAENSRLNSQRASKVGLISGLAALSGSLVPLGQVLGSRPPAQQQVTATPYSAVGVPQTRTRPISALNFDGMSSGGIG